VTAARSGLLQLVDLAPGLFRAFAFLFGTLVGSFLNVVIARVPAGESIVSPRSRCPACRAPIAWYDNVPLLSWVLLRARCRGCGLPISARYPLVELAGGGLALLSAWRFGCSLPALAIFALCALLLALAAIDLDTFWLPEALTLPLLALGLLSPLWNIELAVPFEAWGLLQGHPLAQGFAASLSGAVAGGALLWSVGRVGSFLLGKEAMGFGDVVLLSGLGAWVGVQGLFFVVMFSSLQGAVFGALQLWWRGRTPTPAPTPAPTPTPTPAEDDWTPDPHHIPFGPFLALAALEQIFLSDWIWLGWSRLMLLAFDLGERLLTGGR
jgi:leader peptidase (prepilin peptidase)/N-methyltransferase